MRAIDPVFVKQRIVERDWGRIDAGNWVGRIETNGGRVGEVWALDAANVTEAGPFGRRLMRQVEGMLGDLGRAPPRVRLVFPREPLRIKSTSPVSLWTILEPGEPAASGESGHRPGERIRAYEGAEIGLAPGSVALEVSSSFMPANGPDNEPQVITMPPVSQRTRASLVREDALSVEVWRLPAWSRVVPDGETCHVLVALGQGITIDGRTLAPGAAVFVPAWGRPLEISAAEPGSKLLVAYADRTPTAIWRHAPGPDPAPGQLPLPEPAHPPLIADAASSARARAA